MNTQIKYIFQGFLLMIILLIGIWIVQFALHIKPSSGSESTVIDPDPSPAVVVNQKGKELFQNNCASCHKVDRDLTGPALAGIETRVTDKQLLYTWIRNSQAVLKSGDSYFTALYSRYNKTSMTAFPHLTNEDIENILAYVQEIAQQKPVTRPGVMAYMQ